MHWKYDISKPPYYIGLARLLQARTPESDPKKGLKSAFFDAFGAAGDFFLNPAPLQTDTNSVLKTHKRGSIDYEHRKLV
jgi:hypothetical protein